MKESRTNTTVAIKNIVHLCEEETIKNLIDQDKVDNYSYELYLQLMYTEEDLKTLKETKKWKPFVTEKFSTYEKKDDQIQ